MLVSAERLFQNRLDLAGRVQSVGPIGDGELADARQQRDVQGRPSLERALHQLWEPLDGLAERAPVDTMVHGDHSPLQTSARAMRLAVGTDLPMLTPKATLTKRCKGMGRPMRSWIRFMSISGTMPRVPPPSMHRMPAPAVGGCTLMAMALGVSCLHSRQQRTLKTHGSSSLLSPNTTMQFSQKQWPQGRQYYGRLRRQQRQVLLLWMLPHWPWKAARVSLCMSAAAVLPMNLANKRARWFSTMQVSPLRRTTSPVSRKAITRASLTWRRADR